MSEPPAAVRLEPLPALDGGAPIPQFVVAPITASHAIAPEHFLLRLRAAHLARGVPGQFVMLRASRPTEVHPLLPRPMAIYRYLPASDECEIVYRVMGTGTRLLSERQAGETAEVVGPLGRGFRLGAVDGVLLIGRGIGTCSLTSVAETATAAGARVYAVVSARRPDALIGLDLFAALGAQVFPVTDTAGTSDPARVAEIVEPLLRLGRVQQVLVCGSNRLLVLAARLAAPYNVEVQVSLEAHMACGIGYCHGCSHGAVGESEEAPLVCREGPVFRARLAPGPACPTGVVP